MAAPRKHLNFYLKSLDIETLKQHFIDNKPPQSELDEALKWTCFSGNAQLVDLLVENGANPNSCDQFGTTVLHYAARGRREDVIVALLKHGAAFDRWWSEGESLLHWACHNGFLVVVTLLLRDFQQNENDTDVSGRRLLHAACLHGQLNVAEYLLSCDTVDVDITDENEWTSLHYACSDSEDHGDIIRLLLKHKADPMITTPNGKTALDLAYECGRAEVLIEELSMQKMMHLLISVDSVVSPREASTTTVCSNLNRNISRGISFKADEKKNNLGNNRRNREGVVLGIWRKIMQNDDTELLQMLRDSDVWQGDEPEPFEKAQKLTTKEMTEIFDDCYENGLAVYSYIKLNFQTEITDGDFKGILECLTGLNGFECIEIDGCEIFDSPYTSLTFLALICGRFRVVDSLLRMRQFDILPMGLLVSLIARRLQTERSFPEQVQEALMVFSDATESLLVDALNRIFLKDNSVGKHVSLDTLSVPLKSYGRLSLIDLADKAKCTSFLCLPCCQAVLDERWYGKLSSMTTSWRWSTTLMPILIFVFMTINKFPDEKPTRKRSIYAPLPNASQNTVFRYATQFREQSFLKRIFYIRHVFRSPSVKFFYHSLFHFVFLSVFSYVVLYDLHFKFTLVELLSISFVVGYGLEELRQFFQVSLTASTGHYLVDVRNWLDMTAIAITAAGFITRCFCLSNNSSVLSHIEAHDPVLFISRTILLTGLLFFSIRILFILSIYPILGPKLKMIGDMLKKDLLPLLSIFAIFLVAFGVVFQGLLYPNGYETEGREQLTPEQTVMTLFQRAFYGMFAAEYTADQLDCKSGNCDNAIGKNLVLYLYNVIYVLIVNIMLVNLLIALFSNTVSRIDQQSQAHWLADRYKMVEEYKERSILPPPLNIISVIIEFVLYLGRLCLTHLCCVKLRRAVSTSKNKIFLSIVLVKFLIIQSFALKERRHLLGISSGPITNNTNEKGSSYGVGKLESKLVQLEDTITKMSAQLDRIIEMQQATSATTTPLRSQEMATNVIRGLAHRMSMHATKRTTLQPPKSTSELSGTEEIF